MIAALISAPADPVSSPSVVFAITTIVSAVVAVLAVVIGLIKVWPEVRKFRAETKKVDIDAALATDKAEDEHWRDIVTAQTEALVKPLREEVAGGRAEISQLRTEVAQLRLEVETFRTRYWRAIDHIRVLRGLLKRNSTDALPAAPSEIAADI